MKSTWARNAMMREKKVSHSRNVAIIDSIFRFKQEEGQKNKSKKERWCFLQEMFLI